jgi:hypothetical protein
MRKLTVVYKWEDKKEGTFTHPAFPEPLDLALEMIDPQDYDDPAQADAAAESLAESPLFISLYWGWFRQVLVTWRADAKRHRIGNKSTAPKSEADTAVIMAAEKVPTYKEQAESLSEEQKLEKLAKGLTPAQIAKFLAAAGITEYK